MSYPCILYQREDIDTLNADNIKYIKHTRYSIKYISYRSDESIVDAILNLPMCSFDREYVSDNLKHIIFTIYW